MKMTGPWRVAAIAGLALILWVGQYIQRDLWEPDEARYASVAREMRQTDSWLVPVRNGEFYAHKPPLMFWLINASSLLTGGTINSVSARLPSLLGAVLALVAVFSMARRWGSSNRVAWFATLVCMTAFRFWHQGGWGQIDMLLCGLELTAINLLFHNEEEPALWRPLLAFLAMGLAVLAKGPVGFVIPVGIYVSGTVAAGQGKRLRRSYWVWGPLLALSLPAIWLLVAQWRGAPSAFLHEILFAQNVGRAVGQFGGHVQPWYYYCKYMVLGFMPWTPLFPLAAVIHSRGDPEQRRHSRMLLAWILFVVLFFSLLTTKRGLYILPIYPAASIYLALAWPHLHEAPDGWMRCCRAAFIAFLLFGVLAMFWLAGAGLQPISGASFAWGGVILVCGLVLLLARARLTDNWLVRAIALTLVFESFVGTVVLPELNMTKTPHELVPIVNQHLPEGEPLLLYRINGEILTLYAERRGIRVDEFPRLTNHIVAEVRGLLICYEHDWQDHLHQELDGLGKTGTFFMGSKHFRWLAFDMVPHMPRPY